MDTATYLPPRQRVNFRVFLFIAIVAAPFVWLIYSFVNQSVHKGVRHFGDYDLVDLKSLGNFQFDPNNGTLSDIPPQFRALDGKKVMLEGFMWNGTESGNRLHDFQYVYNVAKCCFNGPPLVQERVFARVPKGSTIPYLNDMSRIVGTLHVNVKMNKEGTITSVYTMDVDKAEPIG